jgi:hypothetical protein
MNWYLVKLSYRGITKEHGWMMAETDTELVDHARTMGYSIEIEYLGEVDNSSITPAIKPV